MLQVAQAFRGVLGPSLENTKTQDMNEQLNSFIEINGTFRRHIQRISNYFNIIQREDT